MAVLVVHNGGEWLPVVLPTLAQWRHVEYDYVVVDNASTDGSAELLADRIPADRLLTLDRHVGFGRAVAAARKHPVVVGADLLLLLHDDLLLAPDAVTRMVDALSADPQLGAVGPKLREWTTEPVLQQVGMTVDRFGRAESGIERDELDQGQHDDRREVLYVSTAGMMIRDAVFEDLRGFDPRFPFMRDDLDLCWRVWIAGHRVAVVPEAVGYHVAAGERTIRPVGRGRPWEARYLSERHALAALLKNYTLSRLAWVLPVTMGLAFAKVLGFLATRRFGSASATVRAYAWNILRLPGTAWARRRVQRKRVRSDAALGPLFAPGLPRVRDYAEAVGGWMRGSDTRALLDEDDPRATGPAPGASDGSLARVARRHPAVAAGLALLAVYLIGSFRLLDSGPLVGGQVLPWPENPWAFLRAYTSRWNGDPLASPAFASPLQALIGLMSFLGFGSAWAAQRLLVLGLLPLAWLSALRAGRIITVRPAPRVLGATLYVLSPPVVATLAHGRYGELVLAAALPALSAVAVRAARPTSAVSGAWRAVAFFALLLAVSVAAAPALWVVPVSVLLVALLLASREGLGRRSAIARLVTAGGLAVLLLSPWLWDLSRSPAWLVADAPQVRLRAGEALLGVPDVVPSVGDVGTAFVAATSVVLVVAGLVLGFARRAPAAIWLVVAAFGWAVIAWGAGWLALEPVWAPGLLLPSSLALAGLGVIVARRLFASLSDRGFGGRQLAAVLTAGVIGLGIVAGGVRIINDPWEELAVAPELVPPFLGADTGQVGPYRVLLLSSDGQEITWEVTDADGASMTSYGTIPNPATIAALDHAVVGLANGDPLAATSLGAASVRYVVVQNDSGADALAGMLTTQAGLEPVPSGGGRVLRVRPWLPRTAVLDRDTAEALVSGAAPATDEIVDTRLDRRRAGLYVGDVSQPGVLVLTEPVSGVWEAEQAGMPASRTTLGEVPWAVTAFSLEQAGPVRLHTSGRSRHLTLVAVQVFVTLLTVSLALRPPSFVDSSSRRRFRDGLPPTLTTADVDPREPAGSG